MSRVSVRKVFITGLVVFVVGGVLMLLTAPGSWSASTDVSTIGLMLTAFGSLIVLVSWIMALIASALSGRWGWFAVVLVLGIIGLLPVVMLVYSLVGPSQRRTQRAMAA